MTEQNMVSFTLEGFKRFKKRYDEAREHHEGSFMFEGNEFLTDYAKYVIEYLQPKFNKGRV
jgi:hypothetical protein